MSIKALITIFLFASIIMSVKVVESFEGDGALIWVSYGDFNAGNYNYNYTKAAKDINASGVKIISMRPHEASTMKNPSWTLSRNFCESLENYTGMHYYLYIDALNRNTGVNNSWNITDTTGATSTAFYSLWPQGHTRWYAKNYSVAADKAHENCTVYRGVKGMHEEWNWMRSLSYDDYANASWTSAYPTTPMPSSGTNSAYYNFLRKAWNNSMQKAFNYSKEVVDDNYGMYLCSPYDMGHNYLGGSKFDTACYWSYSVPVEKYGSTEVVNWEVAVQNINSLYLTNKDVVEANSSKDLALLVQVGGYSPGDFLHVFNNSAWTSAKIRFAGAMDIRSGYFPFYELKGRSDWQKVLYNESKYYSSYRTKLSDRDWFYPSICVYWNKEDNLDIEYRTPSLDYGFYYSGNLNRKEALAMGYLAKYGGNFKLVQSGFTSLPCNITYTSSYTASNSDIASFISNAKTGKNFLFVEGAYLFRYNLSNVSEERRTYNDLYSLTGLRNITSANVNNSVSSNRNLTILNKTHPIFNGVTEAMLQNKNVSYTKYYSWKVNASHPNSTCLLLNNFTSPHYCEISEMRIGTGKVITFSFELLFSIYSNEWYCHAYGANYTNCKSGTQVWEKIFKNTVNYLLKSNPSISSSNENVSLIFFNDTVRDKKWVFVFNPYAWNSTENANITINMTKTGLSNGNYRIKDNITGAVLEKSTDGKIVLSTGLKNTRILTLENDPVVVLNSTSRQPGKTSVNLTCYYTVQLAGNNTYCYTWFKNSVLNSTTNPFDVSSKGTVAYLPFNNDSLDYALNKDGTKYGVTRVTGKVGGAYSFNGNGTTNYVAMPSTLDDEMSTWNNWSIEMWIKPRPQHYTNYHCMIGGRNDRWWWCVYKSSIAYDCFADWYNTTASYQTGIYCPDGSLTYDDWNHLVLTHSNDGTKTNVSLWINGVLRASNTGKGNVRSGVNIDIGRGTISGDDPRGFNGSIDEVNILNVTLKEDKIRQKYYAGRDGGKKILANYTFSNDTFKCEVTPINSTNIKTSVNSSILHIDFSTVFTNPKNYSASFKRYINFTANITIQDNNTISYYVFETNTSGTWTNTTKTVNMGIVTASISKNVTIPYGNTICWRFHSNDGAINYTGNKYCFVVKDTASTFSNAMNSSNTGFIYTKNFTANITVTDVDGLQKIVFSTNASGKWANYSYLKTGKKNTTKVSRQINVTSGKHVGWAYYANVTGNIITKSTIYSFKVQNKIYNSVRNITVFLDDLLYFSSMTNAGSKFEILKANVTNYVHWKNLSFQNQNNITINISQFPQYTVAPQISLTRYYTCNASTNFTDQATIYVPVTQCNAVRSLSWQNDLGTNSYSTGFDCKNSTLLNFTVPNFVCPTKVTKKNILAIVYANTFLLNVSVYDEETYDYLQKLGSGDYFKNSSVTPLAPRNVTVGNAYTKGNWDCSFTLASCVVYNYSDKDIVPSTNYTLTNPSDCILYFALKSDNKSVLHNTSNKLVSCPYTAKLGQNVSILLIALNTTGHYSSISKRFSIGYTVVNISSEQEYEIRYSSPNYAARTYWFQLSNLSGASLKLFLINSTLISNVKAVVYDQSNNYVGSAYVKVLRFFNYSNSYETVEMGKTDNEGAALLHLKQNTEWYKFIIQKNSITYFESVPKQILATTIYFNINMMEDVTKSFLLTMTTLYSSLTFDNNTNTFSLTWNDAQNYVRETCLEVERHRFSGKTALSTQCLESTAGTLSYTINPNITGLYKAYGYIESLSNYSLHPIAMLTHLVNEGSINVFGKNGLFLGIFVVGTLALIGAWNPIVALLMTILGLILGIVSEIWVFEVTALASILAIIIVFMVKSKM